jgi:asparagine synthase (glutamine-hydrolysing)
MFAFAVWDRQERELTLVRDRLGIKPLYWGLRDGVFLFGSELKALRAHGGWRAELDRDALAAYMRYNYVPAPRSIYQGIAKLAPGHMLAYRPGSEPGIRVYWDLRGIARNGNAERIGDDEDAAADRLDALLREAVGCRMIADVPLGAMLSGGIDSSTVVALMQAQSDRPVKTFSIGFEESGFDEAPYARAVAKHLGTEHVELYVEPRHAREVIPNLPEWYDEPFSDSSQIPTYLVSVLARREVTVALSGDGGDELFGGYKRYFEADARKRRLARIPAPLRAAAAWGAGLLTADQWDRALAPLPRGLRKSLNGARITRAGRFLSDDDPTALYRRFMSHFDRPEDIVLGAHEPRGLAWDATVCDDFPEFFERMQYIDTATYLPDDILTKVDRASMAVSLEARVPLLDHRVVEFAWRLPMSLKTRGGEGKHILRKVLERYVPRALFDRPKMGFGVPVSEWLRGPLRDWAEDLIAERALEEGGVIDPAPVRKIWAEHLSGDHDRGYYLWDILMFRAWEEAQKEPAPAAAVRSAAS